MKSIGKALLILSLFTSIGFADARGGGSGGDGHGGGGHSSGGGGGRSSGSSISVSRSTAPATTVARTTTTTSTTTTRTGGGYSGRYIGGGYAYGGLGVGYGYNNGLVTGMILGNMMHPHNTVVYTGGGTYNNNALLYPDGRVVNQNGQQVGVYQNSIFTPINNGPIVAQPLPVDVVAQPTPQPVVIQQETSASDAVVMVLLCLLGVLLFVALIGMLV